jgi:hypothetical protein
VAAKRHRSHWKVSSLAVLLASSLLPEVPPPVLPGKPRKATPPTHCPRDNKALVPAGEGKLRCPQCGYVWDAPAKPG